jgi:hypothetical protein
MTGIGQKESITTGFGYYLRRRHEHVNWENERNMPGNSSVGSSGVYETGNQRSFNKDEVKGPEKFQEGNPNSHLALDSSSPSAPLLSTCGC